MRVKRTRTPLHFPRMKHRAAGRIYRREAMAAFPFIARNIARECKSVAAHLSAMADVFKRITP